MIRYAKFPLMLTIAGAISLSSAQTSSPDSTAPVERVVVKATAHFEFDRTTVLPADQERLLSEVAALKNVTWRTVTAKGYADNVGSSDYNMRLSLKRARAVRAYLTGKGLDPKMIDTAGGGSTEPVADNATASGRASNRRAEVVFEGVRAPAGN